MITKLKKMWHNRSLRTKWFYSMALTILSVYAAVCMIIYIALYSWLIENEKTQATRTVEDLQSFFTSQNATITITDLQQQTGLMKSILTQDQTVRLYNLNGREILQINDYSSAQKLQYSNSRIISEHTVDGIDTFVVEEAVYIGRKMFIIQLIHPLTSFQAMMKYVIVTMLIMGIGAVILSSIISHLLAGRFIRPLTELRNSMLDVKEHGVDVANVKLANSGDEIGDLLKIYNEMLGRLQESFVRQQQFVFDASHELRTPIQAIEGNLALLKRWGKHDRQVLDESLDISLMEINRMKKMMEELLMLAREEKAMVHEPINAISVLNSVIANYPQINISFLYEIDEMFCYISEEAFVQIARNLIENSLRYCDKEPCIKIHVTKTNEHVSLSFSDNGIGILAEHLPYIFDRFYKVDDARLHVEGSTGLGLSIVKMLVLKYRGTIDVESDFGKGTTFFLQLPIKM